MVCGIFKNASASKEREQNFFSFSKQSLSSSIATWCQGLNLALMII